MNICKQSTFEPAAVNANTVSMGVVAGAWPRLCATVSVATKCRRLSTRDDPRAAAITQHCTHPPPAVPTTNNRKHKKHTQGTHTHTHTHHTQKERERERERDARERCARERQTERGRQRGRENYQRNLHDRGTRFVYHEHTRPQPYHVSIFVHF